MQLPIIIGFGGISSAGRSSGHHAYKRLVYDVMTPEHKASTIQSLSSLMGIDDEHRIIENTLVRQFTDSWYRQHAFDLNRQVSIDQDSVCISLSNRYVPESLPDNWHIIKRTAQTTVVEVSGLTHMLIKSQLEMATQAAGSLPLGIEPSSYYKSKNHPRAVQMALFALSDCLGNSGLDWQEIQSLVPPDKVSVYAGSSFSQLDDYGLGGLLKSLSQGKRPTAKQLPLGYSQSPADVANAYVLGNLGNTGATLGACATFLYNLRQASEDIRSGRSHIAVVGASEASLVPELITGFLVMNALCTDTSLRQLDNLIMDQPLDFRRACRPFGNNAGFVMAESAQFFILSSPQLAARIGAQNFGSVADVFINADGYKKSISSTGAGNYITLAKAASRLRSILGETTLKESSVVFAHGTGTPLNRVTESYILNQIAATLGIKQWPVTAIKGQMGHSQGAAAADQLMATLGLWQYDWIPGIETTAELAADVHNSNLNILLKPLQLHAHATLINAKGFGGNNSTGLILSPEVTDKAMKKQLDKGTFDNWKQRQVQTQENACVHDQQAMEGRFKVRYLYDHHVISEKDVFMNPASLKLPGYPAIDLETDHGYGDIFDS